MSILRERPSNINQLATRLGFDYKAIQHHVKVLQKNNMISREGEKYGVTYSISTFLKVNLAAFDEITEKLEKSK